MKEIKSETPVDLGANARFVAQIINGHNEGTEIRSFSLVLADKEGYEIGKLGQLRSSTFVVGDTASRAIVAYFKPRLTTYFLKSIKTAKTPREAENQALVFLRNLKIHMVPALELHAQKILEQKEQGQWTQAE